MSLDLIRDFSDFDIHYTLATSAPLCSDADAFNEMFSYAIDGL